MYFNILNIKRVSFYNYLFQKQVKHAWDKSSFIIVIIVFTGSSKILHKSSPYKEKSRTP